MKLKLDHIYGNTSSNVDLTQINNKISAIEAKNTQQDTQITNLSNIAAKTNISNTFTGNQTINGSILGSNGFYSTQAAQTIGIISRQTEKSFNFDFIQGSAGYRNYCNIQIRHKYANQADREYVTLFKLYLKNTNEGVFMTCENDKLGFERKTTISNAVLQDLKTIVAASTDFNDFKRRIANW